MNLFAAFRRFFHFVKHLSNIAFIYFSPTVYFAFRSFGMFDDFFTKSFFVDFLSYFVRPQTKGKPPGKRLPGGFRFVKTI